MSDPSSIGASSTAESIPSSFDDNPDFFEEARMQKLWRKIKQEPLIPIGCLATCYALYQATQSIRAGDHTRTNRMFRARIYAQGFTLFALVAGSIFYQDERLKRKKFESALEDKKAAEKKEKWLRELEIRDEEERAWRKKVEGDITLAQRSQEVKKAIENQFTSKSIRDQVTAQIGGSGLWRRTRDAWKRV